jgi:hypothetical protein
MKRDFIQHITRVDRKAKPALVGRNLPSFIVIIIWCLHLGNSM